MIIIYWGVLKLAAAPGTKRRFYINQLSKTISADARLVQQRHLSIADMAAGRKYQLKKTLSYPGNTAFYFVSALIVNHATGIVSVLSGLAIVQAIIIHAALTGTQCRQSASLQTVTRLQDDG